MAKKKENLTNSSCTAANQLVNEWTEVRPSKIAGLGLFAKKFMPKGTCWFQSKPEDQILITKQQYLTLLQSNDSPLTAGFLKAIKTYSYYEKHQDALVFCIDNARYVNHSTDPNSGGDEIDSPLKSVALRDIQEGEEITENYLTYDPCPWAASCEDFLKYL